MKNKVVFIVGPTAVGKTAIAYEIAKKFEGELVSADSVQVYSDLDIISGKDLPHNSKFVPLPKLSNKKIHAGYYSSNSSAPIYLLDVVDPTVSFNISDFQKIAHVTIQEILNKNKLPIVIGGTGFYIKALTEGIDMAVKPDPILRKKLDKLTVLDLQKKLQKINIEKFSSMNNSDCNNKRRLIRAIEILSVKNKEESIKENKKFASLTIGLMCEREVLKQRIDVRVEERLKNGAMDEAKRLFGDYENLVPQVKDANGYKQLFQYLRGEIDLNEAIYRWKISEYRHAKNQMTWFQKYGNVKWFDISNKTYERDIESSLKKFLS